ncbi:MULTISPECIES: hypothetical protein [Bacillus cereus group]|uniref:hypothetical protein n=1 Tax=Bacillus cereus group TaxID=86661 RepID=UPI000BF92972|nr:MULTISPECIES: hypothetical protein [Bacillus cereus group]MBY0015190.1 hypothetical protein [Bacillus cereus]MDA2062673.1 hypothetical protein [Bacillus cereus]PES30817.1 hypothetical protein CN493_28695 [Bacillus thuringiensis]
MFLIDEVKQICNRLANHGWRDLLLQHGLDIKADNLEEVLRKELFSINRDVKGFEDFSIEGKRGIEPGQPSRSLLYHALASPNVVLGADGLELTSFPTLAELEVVENYVYGIEPPSLAELRSRVEGAPLAIVVFASEYRPAPETVHRKHADVCFSRTGVARVGTIEPQYIPKNRGFLPSVEGNDYAFQVQPSRFSAYIAVQRKGNEDKFGPMQFRVGDPTASDLEDKTSDAERLFWVPLQKLFNGKECIRDFDLQVELKAHHINEKLKRIHIELHKRYEYNTGWGEPDLNNPPFSFTKDIAEWSDNPDFGTNVLIPVPHPKLVEPAVYQGERLTFNVPKNLKDDDLFSSSLVIKNVNGARSAPEYVHIRHKVSETGEFKDLNKDKDMMNRIKIGGYKAIHYVDYTGDGWIQANCPQLSIEISDNRAAYSLVTAPDFFPNCDQRELMDWWLQTVPETLRGFIWEQANPYTLSNTRKVANLKLKGANFSEHDDTITAIVSLPYQTPPKLTRLNLPETTRHSYLPDAASGTFAPGWDVSWDLTHNQEGKKIEFLAAYGLGSPFPEDSKLCAALSTYWPAVAPDAARTYYPNSPTVIPLTDEEIGIVGNLPWDGINGPLIKQEGDKRFIVYPKMEYVDYVQIALDNKFSLTHTSKVGVYDYEARILTMAYVYKALGATRKERDKWIVLSFREVNHDDDELQEALNNFGDLTFDSISPKGTVYRYEMCLKSNGESLVSNDFNKNLIPIQEVVILFVNGLNVLLKRETEDWKIKKVQKLI